MNLPASIRRRLMNKAQETSRPFQEVLQYFVMERFLCLLSRSPHAGKFVLKGALMFAVWGAPASRPTRDIDLLARMDNSVESVEAVMREACAQPVEPDGLEFDLASLECVAIKEDADYAGVRATLTVKLQNAQVPMQIDMGFGDVVTPKAALAEYPVLLDFAAPHLLGYPRETAVAEKFEAATKLGMLNSRLKDFYDLWLLARRFDFDGDMLASAIRRTFDNRKTAISTAPTALTPAFGSDPAKQAQWQGFLKKSRLGGAPASLQAVVDELAAFLGPVAGAAITASPFGQRWPPEGPVAGARRGSPQTPMTL